MIKRIVTFFSLMLIALSAYAEIVGEIPMQKDHTFFLTDLPCLEYSDAAYGYLESPSGKTLNACWSISTNQILVIYDDGDVGAYPVNSVKINKNYFLINKGF